MSQQLSKGATTLVLCFLLAPPQHLSKDGATGAKLQTSISSTIVKRLCHIGATPHAKQFPELLSLPSKKKKHCAKPPSKLTSPIAKNPSGSVRWPWITSTCSPGSSVTSGDGLDATIGPGSS